MKGRAHLAEGCAAELHVAALLKANGEEGRLSAVVGAALHAGAGAHVEVLAVLVHLVALARLEGHALDLPPVVVTRLVYARRVLAELARVHVALVQALLLREPPAARGAELSANA